MLSHPSDARGGNAVGSQTAGGRGVHVGMTGARSEVRERWYFRDGLVSSAVYTRSILGEREDYCQKFVTSGVQSRRVDRVRCARGVAVDCDSSFEVMP